MIRRLVWAAVFVAAVATATAGQPQWPASWRAPQSPRRIFGNVYYVGARGVSAILITSPDGHVLLDAPMQENAAMLVANIAALGFRIEDVKLILNSHAHFDHAGAMAELQRLSGARVAALAPSREMLRRGRSGPDDPQYGVVPDFPPVAAVQTIAAGEIVRVGPLALAAHATPGHTAGGTTWTWRACQDGRCLDMVYADSLGAASRDFDAAFATVAALPCDILLTPHPDASDLWPRIARRDRGDADALIDRGACARYVESARAALKARIEREAVRG